MRPSPRYRRSPPDGKDENSTKLGRGHRPPRKVIENPWLLRSRGVLWTEIRGHFCNEQKTNIRFISSPKGMLCAHRANLPLLTACHFPWVPNLVQQVEADPKLANQFCLLYHPSRGPLRGPCAREGGGGCSPLADGAHDAVGTFPLVEPRVVAVPHQLAGLGLVSPHVLVEVPEVHVGELLQAQHPCTGHPPPSGPVKPRWGGRSGRPHLPTHPGLRHWGGHVHLSPNPDSWVR